MTPNMIQAVAQTRIDDFTRAADRRRLAATSEGTRDPAAIALKAFRPRRRLRLGIA